MVETNEEADSLLDEGLRIQRVVPQTDESRRLSFELVSAAAELGSVDAMVWCAEAYQTGFGIKSNLKKARKLAEKASQLGSARAKYVLADMIIRDRKNPNPENAFQLALDASKGGDSDADFMLAWMLYRGFGAEKDEDAAISKLNILAEQGQKQASDFLDEIRLPEK